MRTPQRLVTKAGEPYLRVRSRMSGQKKALTFYGASADRDAREFIGLLDALGPERAVTWWNDHLEQLETGDSLDDWWPRYLASLTGITDGTRVTYDRTYRRVWQQPLGARPLTSIGREDVAGVVNTLSARKPDKTVGNAFGVLSSCFKVAVRDGLVPANPCAGIRLPRRTEHTDTEMRFLTYDEWAKLHDELPRHYQPLFTALIGTGMRWGEAEALTVRDIVLADQPVVRISKAAKWNASRASREIGPTKTRKSRRTVTLPPEVLDELRPLLDRPGHERPFLAPRGGPLRHRTV